MRWGEVCVDRVVSDGFNFNFQPKMNAKNLMATHIEHYHYSLTQQKSKAPWKNTKKVEIKTIRKILYQNLFCINAILANKWDSHRHFSSELPRERKTDCSFQHTKPSIFHFFNIREQISLNQKNQQKPMKHDRCESVESMKYLKIQKLNTKGY